MAITREVLSELQDSDGLIKAAEQDSSQASDAGWSRSATFARACRTLGTGVA